MTKTVKRVLRHVFGWLFIVLGVIGLFLPVLQGVLFIVVGVSILTPEIPLFHRTMVRLEDHYPKVFEKAHRMKQRFYEVWKGK
jgi:uncharacterized protein